MLETGAQPVSAASPTVRVVAALAAATATAFWIARYGVALEAVVATAFFSVLAVLTAIDIESRRIPNRIVLPAAAVAFAAVALLQPESVVAAAVASAGAFLFFSLPSFISARAVGMGDAKLALLIGVVLGTDVVSALLGAVLAGGLAAAALVAIRGRRAFAAAMPYGPFLAFGAIVAFVAGGGTLYS